MALSRTPTGEAAARLLAVDLVLLAYLVLVSVVALARLGTRPLAPWVLLSNLLIVVLIFLFTRRELGPAGVALHEIYPLLLLVSLYSQLDLLNGVDLVHVHDALIQHWETAAFGTQISRTWWQSHPSRFWSTVLHAAYFSYYLIIPLPPAWFAWRRDLRALRRAVLMVMATFVVCYSAFLLFPVAGPYYAFPHPTGSFVANLPARLVYATLAEGSSYGAAFPSSHVAATVAATLAGWLGSRRLGAILLLPTVLLTVGVVYCQMHYGVDALAGLATGAGVVAAVRWLEVGSGWRVLGRPLR